MIFLFIVLVILVGFRIALISGALDEPVTKTVCPNCKYKTAKLSKGRHTCEHCSFHYDVDRKGNAIKYSKSEIFTGVILGIFFAVATVFLAIEMAEKFLTDDSLKLEDVSHIVLTIYLSVICFKDLPRNLKGNKFYREQTKELPTS